MRAYSTLKDFSKNAEDIIRKSGIELTINPSKNRPSGDELVSLLKEYDILLIGIREKLTSEMLNHIDKPKIIGSLSVGVDHIDKSFFGSPLITVVNIKTANAISVAEHILGLILALNKSILEGNELVLRGRGHKSNLHERPDDISGKTLGLIGAGNIIKELVKLVQAFNMNLKCFTKDPEKHAYLKNLGVEFLPLDEVLKQSDIINASLPLTDETRNLISAEKIALMKPTATFINTSRADIIDINALIDYSEEHETFHVGLDIDLDDHRELFMKHRHNVVVTPHTAGVSKQAIARMDIELAEEIVALVSIS